MEVSDFMGRFDDSRAVALVQGLENIGPAVSIMAGVEGLEAHRKSITLRLESSS